MTALDPPSNTGSKQTGSNDTGSKQTGDGPARSDAGADTLDAERPLRSVRTRKRKVRLLVAGAVLVGAFGYLLVEGLTNSLNYFETVNQAIAMRATLGTQTFRLEGLVVPGTIHPTSTGVNFTVESSGVKEPVVETGQPPQLFQPDIPVVLVGHFAGPFFASDQILVDHTSQYIAEYPSRVTAPNGSIVGQTKKQSATRPSAP
jgi:cytochrome c-type biogenesis protein CcmE